MVLKLFNTEWKQNCIKTCCCIVHDWFTSSLLISLTLRAAIGKQIEEHPHGLRISKNSLEWTASKWTRWHLASESYFTIIFFISSEIDIYLNKKHGNTIGLLSLTSSLFILRICSIDVAFRLFCLYMAYLLLLNTSETSNK